LFSGCAYGFSIFAFCCLAITKYKLLGLCKAFYEITLESVVETQTKKAICLSGKGACPPEDCGSIYGYEGMQEFFATMPESEEAEEYRDWLGLEDGENWDADAFDIDEVNNCLKQV
jgi:hypothetical protein